MSSIQTQPIERVLWNHYAEMLRRRGIIGQSNHRPQTIEAWNQAVDFIDANYRLTPEAIVRLTNVYMVGAPVDDREFVSELIGLAQNGDLDVYLRSLDGLDESCPDEKW